MRRKLTNQQRRSLLGAVMGLFQQGRAEHTGLLGEQAPDWTKKTWVLGTSEYITQNDIRRSCADCGENVYTSVRYPDDIAIICEVCAYAVLIEEAAA